MYCLFFLSASLFLCQVSSDEIERIILDYFKSESVRKFRKEWENHRKPLEHAVSTALKETVGFAGMNVYIRKVTDKLAAGYYHNDNQVQLILKDLNLQELPRCWLPEVQFSLASNVLKIQTVLSKMIIHAEYALVRNKSDILYEPKDQDPYKSSPFLFQQVQDIGKVAITVDGCLLSGFIIATLNGESVNLGYDYLKMLNCQYTIEIYRPGEDSPPVIAKYIPFREDEDGLGITDLLLKPLSEELVPKLQAAMFSFINTSSIFDDELREFRENQEVVFLATSQYLTEIIRNLNKITIEKNHGSVEMEDYTLHWDDGRIKRNNSNQKSVGEELKLMDMVLTGLDTMYSSHSGGPYKMNTVMIAEELRFSSLQVRGYLEVKSTLSNKYSFAAEISDMVVDLHLDVNLEQAQWETDKEQPKSKKYGFKKLEVTGLRRMIFTIPTVIFGTAESLLGGYLLKEVPKQIKMHLKAIFPQALNPPKTKPLSKLPSGMEGKRIVSSELEEFPESEVEESSEEQRNPGDPGDRGDRKKYKKRFKSPYQPRHRRRYRSHKHEADNQISKK